jgi:uncharacterized membrane protein YjfL (UPF0719 family)
MYLLAVNSSDSFNKDIFDKVLLSVGFGCIGIILLVAGHKLFHMLDLGRKLTRIDFKEQIQKGNTAAALYEGLVEAAFLLGLAYIVGQVVS